MKMNKRFYKVTKIIMLLIAVLSLTACGKKKIDVTETLSLKYDGADGYGTVEIINAYDWEDEALKAIGIENIEDFSSLEDAFKIESAVSYEVLPNNNLSNGDEVTVKVHIDEAELEEYQLKLIGSEKKFVVEGLPEIQQVDLFDYANVSFMGASPFATANFLYESGDKYGIIRYVLDKDTNLAIGDVITVTAEYDKEEMLENGYIAESDTKEFEVTNIPKYISQIAEIPEDANGKMKKQVEDIIQANTADIYGYSLSDYEFLGNYLITMKPDSEMVWNEKNTIYYVYQINITGKKDVSYYYYVGFHDIILTEGNECVYDFKNDIKPSSGISEGWNYINGFRSLDELFNECVTINLEDYEYESNF